MTEEKLVPAVRLATHEIDALVKAQYQEAKLKRLHEVREQAAQFACNIRERGREKRKRVLQGLENKLRDQAEKEQREMVIDMEGNVMNCLTQFGSAHAKAEQENNTNYDEARQADFTRKREKAQRLGKEAMKTLHDHKQTEEKKKNEKIVSRKQALDTEAVRSAFVVSLPPPKVVVPEKPVQEPKVILFDKSTLFQTEYVMKKKVCEPISSPQDARTAAMLSELENEKFQREKAKQKAENDQKIVKRGKEALVREKNHGNYLRLLQELDKMEASGKPDSKWDVESTVTSVDQSCTSSSSKPNSPRSPLGHWSDEREEMPVRDICSRLTRTRIPPLASKDSQQLNEIGQLLKELREEQDRWAAIDQVNVQEENTMNTTSSSSGVVVFSDDDVRIRCGVVEGSVSTSSSSSVDSQRRKDLAKALNALRKQRLEPTPSKAAGILRRPVPLATSATSTPVPQKTRSTPDDNRKQVLQYYVRKLLEMKREEVRDLSVGSSSSTTVSSVSTPKPTGLAPPHSTFHQRTPEWSKTTLESTSSTSAYDSPPVSDPSTSKISNASSLPLGVEASSYGRKPPSLPKDDQYSLGPLLDVYNEVYQAYKNQRQEQTTLTESSFMSLTLSTTTSTDQSSYRQLKGNGSPFSVQLTLSSTSSESSTLSSLSLSNTLSSIRSNQSRKDWSEMAPTKSSAISTSSSSSSGGSSSILGSKSGQSSTSSQEISMPDVDEALRRLGLPSMQSVLRR